MKKYLDEIEGISKNDIVYLPPYSPELNPIEKYWAILKRKLKKIDENDRGFKDSIHQLF